MSKTVKLKKGLDIKLVGEAEKVSKEFALPSSVSIFPPDFHGLTPKMVVKQGDKVQAGDVVFYNKYEESVKCVSPLSGTIREIIRGDKRRILEIVIDGEGQQNFKQNEILDVENATGEAVKQYMLDHGLWMFIKQRPIDMIANPNKPPKAIFVSAFDSSPLAPDYDFILHGENVNFQAGLNALTKLT